VLYRKTREQESAIESLRKEIEELRALIRAAQ